MTEVFLLGITFVLVVIVVAIVQRRKRKGLSPSNKSYIQELWDTVLAEGDHRQHILGADSVLDETMRLSGYTEKGLGSKLKAHPQLFRDLNGVWWAHKLRNTVAHEVSFRPTSKDAEKALKIFRKALNDLGAELT